MAEPFEALSAFFESEARTFAKTNEVPLSVAGAAMIDAGTRMFGHGAEELALWFDAKARELRASLGRGPELN